MGEFRMPSLGADMDAGTIIEWTIKPGDSVKRGDIVARVETDKADIDAEVFEDGVVEALLVEPGVKVPVGTVLATIGTGAGTGAAVAVAPPVVEVPAVVPIQRPVAHRENRVSSPLVRHLAEEKGIDVAAVAGSGIGGTVTRTDVEVAALGHPAGPRKRVSPRARRLAAELPVDVEALTGSGPGGAVIGADIESVLTPTPVLAPLLRAPAHRSGARTEVSPRQARTAALMERANREIPHYYLDRRCDMTTTMRWLEAHNATLPPAERMLPAALLMAAVAKAAASVDGFNGHWVDGAFQPAAAVDLGVVVSLRDGGLMVPVIASADTLALGDLMTRLREVVSRTRAGKLRSSDLGNPTISVTNLGDQGAEAVFGVIYPPQVAIVGFGRVHDEPWADNGMLGVRPIVRVTLSGDHRVSDGHRGSRFLAAIDHALQTPEEFL